MFAGQSSKDLKFLASALSQGRLRPPFSDIALSRLGISSSIIVLDDLSTLTAKQYTAEQIAGLVEAVASEREYVERADAKIEIVATDPDVSERVRDTAIVIEQLFLEATRSVLVVGFALYQGQKIFKTLANHMDTDPALRVVCCFDISRQGADTTRDSDLVDRFGHRFVQNEWPGKRLPEVYYDPRGLSSEAKIRAVLHAKTIVVDRRKVIVTSANPTQAAYTRNIELGVVIDDTDIAKQIEDHFLSLINGGYLQRVYLDSFKKIVG